MTTTYTLHASGKVRNRWAIRPAVWAFGLGAWLLGRVATVVLVDGKPLGEPGRLAVDISIRPADHHEGGFHGFSVN